MTDEELHNLVLQSLLAVRANNGARQRIMGLEQLEKLIAEGWGCVMTSPDERAVIRMPFQTPLVPWTIEEGLRPRQNT